MNIGEYCPSLVQYDILFGTIFTNIHAITLATCFQNEAKWAQIVKLLFQ
jgi:hypothetical protein